MQFMQVELDQIRQLMSEGQLAGAEALCRKVLHAQPQLAEAWFLLAQLAAQYQQVSDAISCIKQAIQFSPTQSNYLIFYAHLLLTSGKAEAAYQVIKPVMAQPQPVTVQLLFGRVAWLAGRYADALAGFSAAASTQPVTEHYILPYARALTMLGQREQACNQLKVLIDNNAVAAESATLLMHMQLSSGTTAELLNQVTNYASKYSQHNHLRQLTTLLTSWLGNAAPDFSSFTPAYQQQSIQYVLAQRDKQTKLAGLPVDVLLDAISAAEQDGLWLEFGVYYGRSINIIAQYRDGLVHGFDSFAGLPEDWKSGEPKGSYSTNGRLPAVRDNVRLHQGWFEQSLPVFLRHHSEHVSLVHIDCDLYSSTATVLSQLACRFRPGTILIFDDFLGIEGFEQHEFKAFAEFVQQSGFSFRLLSYAALGREVAFQLL